MIEVQSSLGHGSVFQVRLPLAVETIDTDPVDISAHERSQTLEEVK
jgi:chemotaxis protein histidine kinase CheA